jgi:ATP-dependent DNA helicase RecQ
LRLDSGFRRVFHPAAPDAVLLRFSHYNSYQSETQKAAVRALLTAPSGASLAVSMPTGSGKSLLFQVGPRAWRPAFGDHDDGAASAARPDRAPGRKAHQRHWHRFPDRRQSRILCAGRRLCAGAATASLF